MYYMVNNDATLVHQTNDDITKFIKKSGWLWQQVIFWDNVYKLNALYSPCLLQKTNYLLKYDKKVMIFK